MDLRMGTVRQPQTDPPVYIRPSFFGRAMRILPGMFAGPADLDPAAVLTATVAGAAFGTSLGWVVVLCIPVLFSVFSVSSRIGHETRKGLVELIRENYSRRWSVAIAPLIAVVNLAMIVGDIVAVSDGFSLITI